MFEQKLNTFKVLDEEDWIDESTCDHLHIHHIECSCGRIFRLTRYDWDKNTFWIDKNPVKGHLKANPEHYIKKKKFDCVDS